MEEKVLKHDPLLESERILKNDFYGRGAHRLADEVPAQKKEKPTHYKIICISMYTKDIEQLENKVAELKKRGHTKANKSKLIRIALSQLDIDKLPPPQP